MKANVSLYIITVFAAYLLGPQLASAQDTASRFRKQHIKGTEAILVEALKTKSGPTQRGILQHIRFLEWSYPEEEFGSFIEPLTSLVKDEKADLQSRMLAALGLEGLHSPKGDAVIMEMASSAADKCLQELCAGLIVEPFDGRYWNERRK